MAYFAKIPNTPPNDLRQLLGGFVSLNFATPNPTMRVRYFGLRER